MGGSARTAAPPGPPPGSPAVTAERHELDQRLTRLVMAATLDDRVEALEDLASWLHPPRGWGPWRRLPTRPAIRLRWMLGAVEASPDGGQSLRARIGELARGLRYERLFTDTGLPGETSFFDECQDRLARGLLPEPPAGLDAARLLYRLFPDHRRSRWFFALDPGLRRRLLRTLLPEPVPAAGPADAALREAAVLLSVRIAEAGSADLLRDRCPALSVRSSEFLRLPGEVRALVWPPAEGPWPVEGAAGGVTATLEACEARLREVEGTLEHSGISLRLVHRLRHLRDLLARLRSLLQVLRWGVGVSEAERTSTVEGADDDRPPSLGESARLELLHDLVRGGLTDRSAWDAVRVSSRLIALRVITRSGHSGEHYIARDRAEQRHLLASALGGGAVIAPAVLIKLLVSGAHLPLFFEAMAWGTNYAGAFVCMQLVGFTLATKQPSMTAATLAHAIHREGGTPDLEPLIDQVVSTVRSQLMAVLGNVGMVVPVALGLSALYRLLHGSPLLSPDYADALFARHHPLDSGTLLFAALSGLALWLGAMVGGTVENWFVLRRLPETLRTHRRLRHWLGDKGAARLAAWSEQNISALAGSLGLAALLVCAPVLSGLFGVPTEVRHVTFVTGTLVFAAATREPAGWLAPDALWAFSSIGLVAILNFGVSFSLALFVALRAKEIRLQDQARLGLAVLRRCLCHPFDLLRSPASPPG